MIDQPTPGQELPTTKRAAWMAGWACIATGIAAEDLPLPRGQAEQAAEFWQGYWWARGSACQDEATARQHCPYDDNAGPATFKAAGLTVDGWVNVTAAALCRAFEGYIEALVEGRLVTLGASVSAVCPNQESAEALDAKLVNLFARWMREGSAVRFYVHRIDSQPPHGPIVMAECKPGPPPAVSESG